VPGVVETVVGYTGGELQDPTYETCCEGDGHTEAIQVTYDNQKVSYNDLLDVFFKGCRGNSRDVKVQYKDAIWTHNEEQREKALARAEEQGVKDQLDIEDEKPFYPAEDYHQKFYKKDYLPFYDI